MTNTKYIARQVEPESQSSPLMMDGSDDIRMQEVAIIGPQGRSDGNKNLVNIMYEFDRYIDFEYIKDIIREASNSDDAVQEIIDDISSRFPWYAASTEYNPKRQLIYWKCVVEADETYDEPFPKILTCMTGKKYVETTIHGSSQSEWARLIHPADWTDDMVERFEAEYFNTGEEWMLYPADDPDDVVSVYTTGYNEDLVKKEISEDYLDGVKPEEIELQIFTGYERIPQYRVA